MSLYSDAANPYIERGWWPIPLPVGKKVPPPAGVSGSRNGNPPTAEQVKHWSGPDASYRTKDPDTRQTVVMAVGNIAVRMPPTIIGIDVDDGYTKDGTVKNGAAALGELEAQFGLLPATYSSTARGWCESRIRFYAVPHGTRLRANPADSIEIIQHHHRYAVAWPSIHPNTGTEYTWYDDVGEPLDLPPEVDELAVLPWAWIEGLAASGAGVSSVHATPAEVEAFYDEATSNAKPEALVGIVKHLVNGKGARHDRLIEHACWAAREARAGFFPMRAAEAALHTWWTDVIDNTERLTGVEFDDAIAWAIAQVDTKDERMQRLTAEADQARTRHDVFTMPDDVAQAEDRISIPITWSDAHVGEAFGHTLAGRWLYCRALGGWMRWDGRRWHVDPGEAVHEEFRQWIIGIGAHIWRTTADSDTMKQVGRYRDKGKIDATVVIARRLEIIAASAGDFDREPHLLNVLNGVLDLRDGTLHPHDPALRITRLAGADYDPSATHADLTTILKALDPDVEPWVQRLFGSAAFGAVVDDVLAVFDGTGSNGKTTILKAVAIALGEYAAPASTRLLMARGVSDEHPTLIADLFGRRLVYIEETPEGGALRMEQVKNITGGGALKARFIGRDYFEFEPTHQIIVATNHRPAVNASDYAAWRRLRLVPFTRTYRLPHEAQPGDLIADRGLRGRLTHPAQRQAVLAWVVAGAIAWHHDGGLGGCAPIDEATSTWRRDEDVIHAWWADCLEPGLAVAAAELYRSYSNWCNTNGRQASSNKEFAKRLMDHDLYRKHGVERHHTNSGWFYRGVKVTDVTGVPTGSLAPLHEEPSPSPVTSVTTRANVVECCSAMEADGTCFVHDDNRLTSTRRSY
jgi:putative DNA primase/helicase